MTHICSLCALTMPARHDNCLIGINQQVDRVRLEHFGSGILIRLRELFFLFSAAHVLVRDRLWLPGKPAMPLDEAGRIFATTPFDSTPHSDVFDLAYVLLSERAVAALRAIGRTFLESTELVGALPPLKTAEVVFVGIPCSKSETNIGRQEITTTPTYIRTVAYSSDQVQSLGRHPRLHLGLKYIREKLTEDSTGKRVNGPIPDGMSGGPMWLILRDGTPKLWAIGTHYDLEKKVLFGSKIQSLLPELLKRHFGPDFPVTGS